MWIWLSAYPILQTHSVPCTRCLRRSWSLPVLHQKNPQKGTSPTCTYLSLSTITQWTCVFFLLCLCTWTTNRQTHKPPDRSFCLHSEGLEWFYSEQKMVVLELMETFRVANSTEWYSNSTRSGKQSLGRFVAPAYNLWLIENHLIFRISSKPLSLIINPTNGKHHFVKRPEEDGMVKNINAIVLVLMCSGGNYFWQNEPDMNWSDMNVWVLYGITEDYRLFEVKVIFYNT